METLLQDIKYGLRMLRKSGVFTIVAVMALALGIGANTAVFSLADKLLFRSLPVQKPEQLVRINSISVSPYFVSNIFSYPNYIDYRNQNSVFSGMIAFRNESLNLRSNDRSERVAAEIVSGNYFDVLGIKPSLGRAFLPSEDEASGAAPAVVISDGFWRRRFGADPNAIGKTIALNDSSFTIVGIAPPQFTGMVIERPVELWAPITTKPLISIGSKALEQRNMQWIALAGRLKDGVAAAQAETEMDALAQRIKDAFQPRSPQSAKLPFSEQHIKFEPLGKGISGLRKEYSGPLKLLLAVVGLVLLIACANVAGLQLARSAARRKEIAVRQALGAGRLRLVRQMLTESMLLAFAGGASGLLLAPWLTILLLRFQPAINNVRTPLHETLDLRVLLFTLSATALAGILFGLVPALQNSRIDLTPALKDDAGLPNRIDRLFGIRNLLVAAQLVLAFTVLVGAGLLVKSLRNLFAINPGFQTENVLLVPIELDPKKYDVKRSEEFRRLLFEKVKALPGVASVSSGEITPLGGSMMSYGVFIEGYAPKPDEDTAFDCNFVGPDYYNAMGIQIVQGRGFTELDREGAPGVAVVNESFARRFFPGESGVGKRISINSSGPFLEIVGVSRDCKYHELTETPIPHFDLPASQHERGSYFELHVRSKQSAENLLSAVRREVESIDPSIPFSGARTIEEQLRNSIATARLAAALVSLFGLLAALLAAIGLYGAIAYSVSRRTREIAIRIALGAETRDVLRLVVGQAMATAFAGIAIGLIAAFALSRLIESLLYGVSATDPAAFAGASLLLAATAALACYVPARRATKIDPMTALRYE